MDGCGSKLALMIREVWMKTRLLENQHSAPNAQVCENTSQMIKLVFVGEVMNDGWIQNPLRLNLLTQHFIS